MKHYIVYKITNLVNNKIYIGKHITSNLNDRYMGSSKHLRNAISKYGLDKFNKEVLFKFDNEQDMNNKEKELVDLRFVNRKDVYNKICGGEGSFTWINANLKPEWVEKRTRTAIEGLKIKRSNPKFAIAHNKHISEGRKRGYVNGTIKTHINSREVCKRIGIDNSKRQSGTGNSLYGRHWIYNFILSKSICVKQDQIKGYLDSGWIVGRKFDTGMPNKTTSLSTSNKDKGSWNRGLTKETSIKVAQYAKKVSKVISDQAKIKHKLLLEERLHDLNSTDVSSPDWDIVISKLWGITSKCVRKFVRINFRDFYNSKCY